VTLDAYEKGGTVMSSRSHSIGAGVLVAAVLALLLPFTAQARTYGASDDLLEASLQKQMAARGAKNPAALEWDVGFDIGSFWLPYISNKGFIGLAAMTGEYPGGSANSHLWQGGVWLGGYVDTTGQGIFNEDPWMSVGTFDQFDFLSYDDLDEVFQDLSEGNQRTVRTRFNTAYSQRDLGVTVEWTLRAWDQTGYDNFVVIESRVSFNRDVEEFYFGWMSDCDVGNNVISDFHIDDLAGFDAATGLAYMYDADGDPIYPDQPDGEKISTTAIGQILLEAPSPGGSVTAVSEKAPVISWSGFNWWDWNGDVTGQSDAYERLSSNEKDGALPTSGFDYRIQTGVGPYSAEAGDEAVFVMAYVLGDGVTQPNSSLGSLIGNTEILVDFYNGGYELADVSPPMPWIETPVVSGLTAEVSWSADAESDPSFDHYNLYWSHATAIGPWEHLADLEAGTNLYEVELRPGFEQFFLVTSEGQNGLESNWNSAYSKTLSGVEGSVEPVNSLDRITVAPNPYVGSADWELTDYEGKILFSNLPERCTLRIYNLAGDVVYSVEHNDSGLGTESWNLLTDDRQSVATGLYLYAVTAPGLGQKVGKFAVVNGQR
jgi:hypothetical protein